ncbi:MAG TPA: hypothetical protein VFT16_05290 [Candidatus Saccharimonadales bacterium]|nr:hypothetical protein [Candidatus Saccharimonadales bacterium]
MEDQQIPAFHPSVSISGDIKRLERPWGFRLYPDPSSGSCINGLIHVEKGEQAQLTIDSGKQRSWFIVSGKGFIVYEDEREGLVKTALQPGVGYTSQEDTEYQLEAVTDCDVIELVKR